MMNKPLQKGVFTVKELAEFLKVSEDWVRDAAKSGRIPKVPHLGRHVRFHPDTIEAMFGTCSLKTESSKRAGSLDQVPKWRRDGQY